MKDKFLPCPNLQALVRSEGKFYTYKIILTTDGTNVGVADGDLGTF